MFGSTKEVQTVLRHIIDKLLALKPVYKMEYNGTVFYVDAYTAFAVEKDHDFIKCEEAPETTKHNMLKMLSDPTLRQCVDTGELRDIGSKTIKKVRIFKSESGQEFGINEDYFKLIPKHYSKLKVPENLTLLIAYEYDIPVAVIACVRIQKKG